MSNGSFKFYGSEEVIRNIERFGKRGVEAATIGIDQFGLFVLAEAQKIVPFDKGDLQEKIIDQPVVGGVKVIGFEGPYAAKQHEDTTLTHPGPRSKNPERGAKGRPKYLEEPLKKHRRKLLLFIGSQLDKIK